MPDSMKIKDNGADGPNRFSVHCCQLLRLNFIDFKDKFLELVKTIVQTHSFASQANNYQHKNCPIATCQYKKLELQNAKAF